MVKLFKISIVISMGVWLIVIAGCEKPTETKELKRAPMVVSGTILRPSPEKVEKKLAPQSPVMGQALQNQTVPPLKTGVGKMALNLSDHRTEILAKKAQIVAIDVSKDFDVVEPPVEYDPKGKIDPFIPLLQEKEVLTPDIDQRPKRILTPLEKFGLSQINLVAVILMENRQIAMVEDASGKGYEVKIGTYIGKNGGQVSKINQSSIVVKEYVKDYKGKRQAQLQKIKLHKKESGE